VSRPRRNPDYRLEAIDGELLLFHPERAAIMYCNETASLIWQLCDGERTTQEIVDLLVDTFPEAAATIPSDVESTLQELHQHGAIRFK
jgi:hypothetical protein